MCFSIFLVFWTGLFVVCSSVAPRCSLAHLEAARQKQASLVSVGVFAAWDHIKELMKNISSCYPVCRKLRARCHKICIFRRRFCLLAWFSTGAFFPTVQWNQRRAALSCCHPSLLRSREMIFPGVVSPRLFEALNQPSDNNSGVFICTLSVLPFWSQHTVYLTHLGKSHMRLKALWKAFLCRGLLAAVFYVCVCISVCVKTFKSSAMSCGRAASFSMLAEAITDHCDRGWQTATYTH